MHVSLPPLARGEAGIATGRPMLCQIATIAQATSAKRAKERSMVNFGDGDATNSSFFLDFEPIALVCALAKC